VRNVIEHYVNDGSTVSVCLLDLSTSYGVFPADTLRYAVTVTFDLLTLNVCSTLYVTCSKSAPSLSEIEQFPAELLVI